MGVYIYIYIDIYIYVYHVDTRTNAQSIPRVNIVVHDSEAIFKCIIFRKQKSCSCAPSTTGATYAASGAWRA